MIKVAELWEPLEDKKVKCNVCAHHCVIPPGKRGICGVRENRDGTLYTLIYSSLSSTGSIDPIEKKPLYHFYPGSNAYSIATVGCNFRCKHCQNWEISQARPNEDGTIADFREKDKKDLHAHPYRLAQISPEETVLRAKETECTSIAYTYNEPTIWFEYVKDCSILAHQNGIKNVLVTNGYSSSEANAEFVKFIDAANVDIKAFTDRFYREIVGVPSLKPVLDTCEFFKKNGVHVEITNLIIPGENDNLEEIRQLSKWVHEHLGSDTPLHFSAYTPRYRLYNPRTPPEILQTAYKIAKEEGLDYVFLGNVYSSIGSDTLCPKCGAVILERHGYHVKNRNLTEDNRCAKCGEKIAIKGHFVRARRSWLFI